MDKKFKRRDFIKKIYWGSLGLIGSSSLVSILGSSCKTAPKKLPNIVLIMADDMGYSDIGCYGGEISTPNIDSLADKGLRFTNFYNTARCCPTRASLLTGLYSHQAGMGHMLSDRGYPGYKGDLQPTCVTIAEVLKQAGYATYMTGKWHVTRFRDNEGPKHNWPLQRGFDRFFGTIEGAASFYDPLTLSLDNQYIDLPSQPFYYTDAISDYAVKFLREHQDKQAESPFFLYVPYTSPHWPLHALEEDITRYKDRFRAGWDVLRQERYQRMIKMGLIKSEWKLTERDPRVSPWEKAEHKEWQMRRMEVYAAQIDRMDQGIGRILSQLKRSGELDNTLIFFLADNGGCAEELTDSWMNWLYNESHICPRNTREGQPVIAGNNPELMPGPPNTFQSYGVPWANVSNTPFRLYKHWTHEGGVATPLIIHWPAAIKAKGEFRDCPGHLIDIMATCVDISGANYPTYLNGNQIIPMEGKSLVPVFHNQTLERDGLFFEHEGNRAVHWDKWKLVAKGERSTWELYDMEADRTETNNLASGNPELVKQLSAEWKAWAERAKVLPWPWKKGGIV